MIAYAAYTSNRKSLRQLRIAGWGVLLSPATGLRSYGLPYALDNGAWSAFVNKRPFDFVGFEKAVEKIGNGARFIVAPDIVEGGLASLELSRRWLPWVLDHTMQALIAVQDGMTRADLRHMLNPRVGVFVGGSTSWKEETMSMWAQFARHHRAICHVGRVNSVRRIRLCAAAGVTSFDGSSASRFSITVPKLDHARHQPDLFAG